NALILSYGVLIPNTRRRSLLVVAALAAVPLAVLPPAIAVSPILRQGHFLPLALQWALTMLFPVAIAVFVATRTAALQRRAFEAERRAAPTRPDIPPRERRGGGEGGGRVGAPPARPRARAGGVLPPRRAPGPR